MTREPTTEAGRALVRNAALSAGTRRWMAAEVVKVEDEARATVRERDAETIRRQIYAVWPGLSQTDMKRIVYALTSPSETERPG